MAALHSSFVYHKLLHLDDREPVTELLPHPDPGRRIFVVRSLTRMHNHSGPLRHPDAVLTQLVRTSDGSVLAGVVLDSHAGATGYHDSPPRAEFAAQQEFDFAPDGFVLEPADTLLVVTSHQNRVGINGYTVAVNFLLAWRRLKLNEETD